MAFSKPFTVTLLFALSLINYTDRWSVAAILNDLQAPFEKGGFNLTDTQGGLVTSVFIVTYMSLSPVFGYFGDRAPRIPLIFGGIVGWSTAGLLASFSTRYWQFLFFRALVGVGEASYAVLSPTIIADLYSGTERTKVLGWYTASIPLGSALGYIYGGEVARFSNWRWAFRITPFLGYILAVILLVFVPEPPRGAADAASLHINTIPNSPTSDQCDDTVQPVAPPRPPSRESGFSAFFADAVEIWRVRSFFWSTWGLVGMTFTAGALAQWATALLQRLNCLPSDSECEATITVTFGVITITSGVLGCIIGPYVSKMYLKRDPAADAIVSAVALFAAAPFVYGALYFSPTRYYFTWILVFIGETLVSFLWPLTTAIQLGAIRPSQRNTANGISLTISHILGDSMSPLIIGMLADKFYLSGKATSRATSLQSALYFSVLSSFVGGFMFFLTAKDLHADRLAALSEFDGYPEVDRVDGFERIPGSSDPEIGILRNSNRT